MQPHEITPWLLERQLDRWTIAQKKLQSHDLVVLDGDHFKMWYDWIYGEDEATFHTCYSFFKNEIMNKNFGFPDNYFVLYIDQEELTSRKINDFTRRRGGFEKHLKLIEPQKEYFVAMNSFRPNYVKFIEAKSIEQNIQVILDSVSNLSSTNRYSLEFFEHVMDWLRTNEA
ncbi:MAG: hypothetical protein ACQEXX_25240 [Bacillota bacterium]